MDNIKKPNLMVDDTINNFFHRLSEKVNKNSITENINPLYKFYKNYIEDNILLIILLLIMLGIFIFFNYKKKHKREFKKKIKKNKNYSDELNAIFDEKTNVMGFEEN